MIRGTNLLNLDSKGRLAIPSCYRDAVHERCDGKMVVTVNNTKEYCLWLYPMDEWLEVEKKIVSLPSFNSEHQALKRFLLGQASDVDMDGSGRILLPAPLREFAMMKKAVVLVGQGNKFEIWSEELWNAKRSQWLEERLDTDNLSIEMGQLSL